MRSNWRSGTVEEIAEFENHLRIPLSAEQRAERPGEYPYWGANGPFDTVGDFLFDGARVLVAEDGNTVVRPDGRGTVHWATGRYWVNNHAHVLNVKSGHDLRWLFYALSAARVRDFVSGSAQPKLSMGSFKRLPLHVPPPAEQRRISSVLGALDDKIDTNRRLARLLEEIAKTEFEARFVDFLGFVGLADSQLGPLPEEWHVGTLADLADVHKQQVKPAEAPHTLFEHFSIPAFDAGNGPSIEPGRVILSAKTTVPGPECVLVSKLNPNTKRVWWPQPDGAEAAVCSPEFLVLVPLTDIPTSYLYAVISSDDRFYRELLSHVAGTTGSRQRVTPTAAMNCRVILPTVEALEVWDALARPLYDYAHSLIAECRPLREVRDMLLPKLISGEVRVPAAADPDDVASPLMPAN
jgi:type I restriction enzyme S subunit